MNKFGIALVGLVWVNTSFAMGGARATPAQVEELETYTITCSMQYQGQLHVVPLTWSVCGENPVVKCLTNPTVFFYAGPVVTPDTVRYVSPHGLGISSREHGWNNVDLDIDFKSGKGIVHQWGTTGGWHPSRFNDTVQLQNCTFTR